MNWGATILGRGKKRWRNISHLIPQNGFVKFSMDRVSKGKLGLEGIVGVIRNERGDSLRSLPGHWLKGI